MHRAIIVSILAAAGAAQGQLNRSFEEGDFSGYTLYNDSQFKVWVTESAMGLPPSHGNYIGRLDAGDLSQSDAEKILDLLPGRLAELYEDLGGTGLADGGDYNIVSIDIPAGNYRFDYMYESLDVGDAEYLDHAFVVNAAGQITVLADNLTGDVDEWVQTSVSHPGGQFYFVCANGADSGFDARLYLDHTFLFDADNGSFETGAFQEWTVADAGAGGVQVVNQAVGGLFPTTGQYYARVLSGNLEQAAAEEALGLEPGRLAELYLELGGTGNAAEGDYAILSQDFGGTSIEFDFAFGTPDKGDAEYLDHAFVVDSEGRITVLAHTLDMDDAPMWRHTVVDHPGGEIFFVSANGADPVWDGALFLDTFREGPRKITTTPFWDNDGFLGLWGDAEFPTFGQTIESSERQRLSSMKFYIEELVGGPVSYRAYVSEWDGEKLVGEPLFVSDVMTTDGDDQGAQAVIIETGEVILEKGNCYVGFLSTVDAPEGGYAKWGYVVDAGIPGNAVTSNADSFDELVQAPWNSLGESDMAAEFKLAPVDTLVVPKVNQFVEGGSSNSFPWGSGGDFRYQQIFAATEFEGHGGVIESFAYRVQSLGQSFGPVDIDVQIWMGHADVAIGGLSATFDDNFTFDKVLVHDGPVTLSSNGHKGFDVVVDIENDFEYDPTLGNLLMEIVMPIDGQPDVVAFDSAGYGFAKGGTPWTDRLIATSADAATGILLGDDGHVTRFNFAVAAAPYDPDCNGDGVYNILDFVCFQQAFVAGDAEIADCDGNGSLNILDFVCFQQMFEAVCP